MIDAITVGSNIAALKDTVGLKSKEFAHEIGVTYNYMSDIECGRKIPSVSLLVKIANYFHVPLSDVLYPDAEKARSADKVKMIQILLSEYPYTKNDYDYLYLLAQRINAMPEVEVSKS
mgnify:CR=1 FL=1